MISAKILARYLIHLTYLIQGHDADITPMKLQKLLYYCQGYSLALIGKPIFVEPIEAWEYGPVIDSVYQEYRKYKNEIIPEKEAKDFENLDETVKSIAKFVVDEKKWLSAYALSNATHNEFTWKSTFDAEKSFHNDIISNEKMKKFFSEKFLEWEESKDEEDNFWLSKGKAVSSERLEAALEDI